MSLGGYRKLPTENFQNLGPSAATGQGSVPGHCQLSRLRGLVLRCATCSQHLFLPGPCLADSGAWSGGPVNFPPRHSPDVGSRGTSLETQVHIWRPCAHTAAHTQGYTCTVCTQPQTRAHTMPHPSLSSVLWFLPWLWFFGGLWGGWLSTKPPFFKGTRTSSTAVTQSSIPAAGGNMPWSWRLLWAKSFWFPWRKLARDVGTWGPFSKIPTGLFSPWLGGPAKKTLCSSQLLPRQMGSMIQEKPLPGIGRREAGGNSRALASGRWHHGGVEPPLYRSGAVHTLPLLSFRPHPASAACMMQP